MFEAAIESILEEREEARAAGKAQGKAEGITEGAEQKALEIAQAMVDLNLPLETIVVATKLDPQQIEKLVTKKGL
ncbi:MAG: hypothetical protein FWH12_07200 [Treponema sp.]|nr:hypothetical protein [Treponema sp.]